MARQASRAPRSPPATSAPFHADVDFAQARRAAPTDDSGVPKTGPMDRILASHFETAQGADFSRQLLRRPTSAQLPGPVPGPAAALRDLRPAQAAAGRAATGMTLLLHSLGGQLQPVPRQPQPVAVRRARPRLDRDHARGARPGRLLRRATPRPTCSRCGPTSRATTSSTPTGPSITGYSMGGFGTFKLAEQFPDLFARAQPTVGDSERQRPGRLAAQHPGADVERRRRRARRPRRPTCRPRKALDDARLPLRARRLHAASTSRSRSTTSSRPRPSSSARRRSTATRRTSPTSPTRASTTPTSASSPTTPTGSRACSRAPRGHGHGRRASRTASAPATRPRSATQFGAGHAHGRQPRHARLHAPVQDLGTGAADRAKANRIDLTATNVSALTINPKRAGSTATSTCA